MRRVIAAAFVSLDGVMQAPGAPDEDRTGGFRFGGWTFPHWDQSMRDTLGETFERPFDLLLGRRTYEIFAAHWPFITDDPVAERFNAVTKYVATSSTAPLDWRRSIALTGDVPAQVAALKQQDGPDLLTQGSSVLVQSLLANGLVDELSLFTFPVLLGGGKRLFGTDAQPMGLRLAGSKLSTTGVVMNRYVPAGEVPTGSFVSGPPSAAELARRERLKEEEA